VAPGDRIESRARFDYIRYANVWEDADVLCDALEPRPGRRILSIASGGDNSFALAEAGADVVAVDLNPAQLAMVELKRVAIRTLEYDDLLGFIGVNPDTRRLKTYAGLSRSLTSSVRGFWDARPHDVELGVIHAGKFERYFAFFRRRIVPLFHDRQTILRLLAPKDRRERIVFYETVWDNWRWRLMFRLFFSRRVMGLMGRDPEFFRYVEGDVADRIMQRARYAFTELPTDTNPYLNFIFTGTFGPVLPRYLARERYQTLREALPRITLVRGAVEQVAETHGPFDGFNLSDIFEYLDPLNSAAIYRTLLDASRPAARLGYWNMLVPRRRPEALAHRVTSLVDEADALLARDRAFFYSAFVLEQVR
jgi:S-adenosylmethionine-diacylglycerol 3-amino-3-carboxypropyl transferase